MANESAQAGSRIEAAGKLSSRPSILPAFHLRRRTWASGNYGKNSAIRIDNVTEQASAKPLTVPVKLLKNNAASTVALASRSFGDGAATGQRPSGRRTGRANEQSRPPQGLCGLFRVGA
jgi:hypothetical protein